MATQSASRKRGLVFVIGHEKGGVGKSSMAYNLAYALVAANYDAAVIDTDTTLTATNWGAIREEANREPKVPVFEAYANPMGTIDSLVSRYDVLIVDVGARDYAKLRDFSIRCDLWILPTKVGQAELVSTVRVVNYFASIGALHRDGRIPLVCVFNATPTSHGPSEERVAREELSNVCPDLVILDTAIGDRKVFREVSKLGRSIYEMPKRDSDRATDEFSAFVKEALQHVSRPAVKGSK